MALTEPRFTGSPRNLPVRAAKKGGDGGCLVWHPTKEVPPGK